MTLPKILIADSSKIQATMWEKQLSAYYDITTVKNTVLALDYLKGDSEYRVVILDMDLPELDGLEILKFVQDNKIQVKSLMATSQNRQRIEAEALKLGLSYFMPKPTDSVAMKNLFEHWCSVEELDASKEKALATQIKEEVVAEEKVETRSNQPYEEKIKCCFICGSENVHFFKPVLNSYKENWATGLFPTYEPLNGFEEWDQLKTLVSVCPYCFFASSKEEDFADKPDSPFPYHTDAKRILSRTIISRRKLLSEVVENDERFNSPYRDRALVIDSLKLADKCMNGLILGEKKGAYSQIGYYQFLLGTLVEKNKESYYKSSLDKFENVFKHKDSKEAEIIFSIYFLMSINMMHANTDIVREKYKWLEDRYMDKELSALNTEEKIWYDRVQNLWENGVLKNEQREIE